MPLARGSFGALVLKASMNDLALVAQDMPKVLRVEVPKVISSGLRTSVSSWGWVSFLCSKH